MVAINARSWARQLVFPARILLPIPPPKHVPLWEAPWYDCLLRLCPERTHSSIRCRLTGAVQTQVLPNRKEFTALLSARLFLPMLPPNTFRSGKAPPPKKERQGFPANLRGARARRPRHQKDTDCAPPPEEHPPDEHAEFRVPQP